MAQDTSDEHPLIKKAIQVAGSQARLAELVGCSQQFISLLSRKQASITADTAIAIDKATNGQVSCFDLRPDLRETFMRRETAA